MVHLLRWSRSIHDHSNSDLGLETQRLHLHVVPEVPTGVSYHHPAMYCTEKIC